MKGFRSLWQTWAPVAGDVAHEWFDSMYESASESGIAFTAIGIVTPDPASVASVLDYGEFPARSS